MSAHSATVVLRADGDGCRRGGSLGSGAWLTGSICCCGRSMSPTRKASNSARWPTRWWPAAWATSATSITSTPKGCGPGTARTTASTSTRSCRSTSCRTPVRCVMPSAKGWSSTTSSRRMSSNTCPISSAGSATFATFFSTAGCCRWPFPTTDDVSTRFAHRP